MDINITIPVGTPVVVLQKDWSELIDRRAAYYPIYGWIVEYKIQEYTLNDEEIVRIITVVELKNGKIAEIDGWRHGEFQAFDKLGMGEILHAEIARIKREMNGILPEIEITEKFVERISIEADFIKEFWEAKLNSLKQELKFKRKKIGKLEVLHKKISKKLDKIAK